MHDPNEQQPEQVVDSIVAPDGPVSFFDDDPATEFRPLKPGEPVNALIDDSECGEANG